MEKKNLYDNNRVCSLFGIKYPIIAGGMAWCSGWRLASAVSNYGGLGLIGAGTMETELLKYHIGQCRQATDKPFGVNVPLANPRSKTMIETIIEEKVPVVFTSAGNPGTYTQLLHNNNIKVCHVVSSSVFAKKAEAAGVDAVVAEGFEAGGHNGREETATICLIPAVRKAIQLPLIAAGGIALKCQMKAAEILGAEGVQIGTSFALCKESSASEEFKKYCRGLEEGGTKLLLKKLSPTRLVKGPFMDKIVEMENNCAGKEELLSFIGTGSLKRGILDGDITSEMELGQVCSLIEYPETVADIFKELIN